MKLIATHVKAMDMMCCSNPVHVTIGTTQTIAISQALPPIVLETKPLEIVKQQQQTKSSPLLLKKLLF